MHTQIQEPTLPAQIVLERALIAIDFAPGSAYTGVRPASGRVPRRGVRVRDVDGDGGLRGGGEGEEKGVVQTLSFRHAANRR